jgi:hypothetical protein
VSGRSFDELADTIRQRLDEDEREALEVRQQLASRLAGADLEVVGKWHVITRPATGTFVVATDRYERVTEVCPTYGGGCAEWIARHDPARVLADVTRQRKMVERLLTEPHGGECHDVAYDDPCECGRDERVRGYLELLAGVDETEAAG